MRAEGITEEDLFRSLEGFRGRDIPHSRIFSSMCTVPHPVALRAHALFAETNLGDPGLFPGTAALEALLVQRLGALFHHEAACGYATSGGTESNIQALRAAKVLHGRTGGRINVVVPASAHFSFQKACDLLSLEMREVPLDAEFRMDVESAAGMVDGDTCCIVAVAGTTEYGMVDPVPALAALARQEDVPLHVDAAFGGLVIPFLSDPLPFDFEVPGVMSIAVDPHKMGMSTIPAGCLLFKEHKMFSALAVETPYLSVKQEFTLSGTRPGGPVVGALAVLEYFGMEGMQDVIRGCMENTRRIIEGMETFGVMRAVTPDVNVATFAAAKVPGPWRVSTTRNGHLRVVLMPHVHRGMVEAFLRDMGDLHA
ncbi:MAG: tyrosine decarboxylase MfnA [Methanomicrobiales archaeon]|jgi:tyrosine decarboxylase/aspartate 1-decarboxylase|nr:tyrosine decarboxylase MfnA [Methanomicrobiales archaeon]